jgi:hypothetical protein
VLRIALLACGAALLAFLVWRLGPSDVVGAIQQVGWWFLALVFLGGLHQAARALALRVCVLRHGVLGYRSALAIRLSGEAIQSLTITGPVLAEPTKAWLLERRGLTLQQGFAATTTEYLVYSFVSAAMAIVGLLYLIAGFTPSGPFFVVAVIVICLCTTFLIVSVVAIAKRFYLIGSIVAALVKVGILRGRFAPDRQWVNRMEDLLLTVLRDSPGRLAAVVAIEIAAQGVLVIEVLWLLRALNVTVGVGSAFLIEAWIKFFDFAFLVIPLQLGVSEGAYAAVFGVIGLPRAGGVAAAFLRRARSLCVAGFGLWLLALGTRTASPSEPPHRAR